MEEKLKIGFLPVAAQFFLQGGMFQKDTPGFRQVEKSIKEMITIIGKNHVVVSNGLITSVREIDRIIKRFMEESVDLIIAANIMWSEDQLILKVIKEFKHLPLLIWCYSPFAEIKNGLTMDEFVRSTGPCGTYQSLPALFRMGKKIKFLVGRPDEKQLQKELDDFLSVNLAVKKLKRSRIALIPSRWDMQTDTLVDESLLSDAVGPEVVHFSINDIKKVFDKIRDQEVDKYYKKVKESYEIENVRDETLKISIKSSCALREFSKIHEIDAISYNENDPDLHEIIGIHPCIYLDDLYESIKVMGMEGDLLNTTMMLIMRYLTGNGIMFSEILTADRKNNLLLMGHPGNHNVNGLIEENSDIKIVPDFEWKDSELNIHGYEGAWMYFVAKRGCLTLSQLIFHRCELKMSYIKAESLNKKVIDFYPQALVELPVQADAFLYKAGEIGCGHHWSIAFGDLKGKLRDLTSLLGIKSVDIGK
jgi:L-fucose isomerase-like protein